MQIKTIIDNIVPERKENGRIVTTGEVSEVLVAIWAHCLIIWSKSRAKLEKEKREKYLAAVKERLSDIATTKFKHRRYKNKEYAQKQVDKCFAVPNKYL